MSVRQRATQCLGKQLPDKPHSRPCNPTSRWPGHHARWHEEQESSKLIQTSNSPASVASERIFRSRETVKAWLESSPTSVLEDLDDESACPSSLESLNSSPVGSIDHLSCTTRFQNSTLKSNQPCHARSRTISPPRCAANRNSVDLSRIDPTHYSGSFLMLAFKNAQYRGFASPPAFQYTSGVVGNDCVQSLHAEECGSPGSEFSLTSEWQYMLAAGNAADMSTNDSSGNNFEFEAPYEVANISDFDLNSDVSDLRAQPQEVRKSHCRTQSMELPLTRHTRSHSTSGELKDTLVRDNKNTRALAKLERKQADASPTHDKGPLRRLLRRNSISSTSMREATGEIEKRKVQITTVSSEGVECTKLINRYEREEKGINFWEDYQREKPTTVKQPELILEVKSAHLIERMHNDMALSRLKEEEKKVIAEAKLAEKTTRVVMEDKPIRGSRKVPRGCLFLV